MEGYYIEPELVAELNERYPNKLKSIYLIKSDKEKFVADIRKSTTPNDWIIARTNNKETYGKIAKMICKYGKFFEKESEKYGFKVMNMDNDFNNKINKTIEYLTTT